MKVNLTIDNIDDVSTQKRSRHSTSKKPFSVAGKNINTVIVGSQEKDKITGTSDGEVLEGMKVANAIYSTLYLQKQMQDA